MNKLKWLIKIAWFSSGFQSDDDDESGNDDDDVTADRSGVLITISPCLTGQCSV